MSEIVSLNPCRVTVEYGGDLTVRQYATYFLSNRAKIIQNGSLVIITGRFLSINKLEAATIQVPSLLTVTSETDFGGGPPSGTLLFESQMRLVIVHGRESNKTYNAYHHTGITGINPPVYDNLFELTGYIKPVEPEKKTTFAGMLGKIIADDEE